MQSRSFVRILLFVCVWSVLCSLSLAGENYYKVLGITKRATNSEIKRAYRNLSKKYHPDKNPGDKAAEEKFVEVANAYEVLSNKDKRRIYDTQGEEGLKKQQQGGGGGGDPFDIFSQFGFGGRRKRNNGEARGTDIELEMEVTLEELYNGQSKEVNVQNQVLCPHCRGSGAEDDDDVKTCKACKGKGQTIKMHQIGPGFMQQVQVPCNKCDGKGKTITKKCHVCKSKKVVTGRMTLDIPVEEGMPDGHKIEFEHTADEHPDKSAGHLIFKIKTRPHKHFRRDGNDLHFTQHISLLEALVGYDREITALDGRSISIKSKKVTHPDSVRQIRDEGMPYHDDPSQKGILHVKFIVDFPKSLTQAQKDGFDKVL